MQLTDVPFYTVLTKSRSRCIQINMKLAASADALPANTKTQKPGKSEQVGAVLMHSYHK